MRRFRVALLLLVALAALAAPARALTLTQMRTEVRRLVRDTSGTAALQRYSDSFLTDQINDAQRDIVNQTWCNLSFTTISLAQGSTYYSLPTTFLAIYEVKHVTASGITRALTEKSWLNVLQDYPQFETSGAAAAPSYYFTRWSDSGTQMQIAVVPAPSVSSSIKVTYYSSSADLSDDSDVPFGGTTVLVPYHYSLVYLAAGKIKLIEGQTEEAAPLLSQAASGIDLMTRRLGERPNYHPNASGAPK